MYTSTDISTDDFTEKRLDMAHITYGNTEMFSFKNCEVLAKVVKVYDGDTCTCVFDTAGLGFYKHSVRLAGIDTPEIKSADEKTRAKAIEAREFLRDKIMGEIVLLKCCGKDKYGRILGIITTEDGTNINDLMISTSHAVSYGGGKKSKEPS